jgi:outer membrane protein assembly factor BamA
MLFYPFLHTRKFRPLLEGLAVCCLAALFFPGTSQAQKSYRLQIYLLDKDSLFLDHTVEFKTAFADSASVFHELSNVLNRLHQLAYAEASFDSLAQHDCLLFAWLHVGRQYQWGSLRNGNVEKEFLDRSGFRERLYQGRLLDYAQIKSLKERILEQAENNGYPFATVRLDSLNVQDGQVEAQVFWEKGNFVIFDSLNVEGNAKITRTYLRNYLGIKRSAAYSRRKVLKIKDRLRELPFLQEKKNAMVRFLDNTANITVYLEKKKASRFDFLLGLLPDNRRVGNKLLLTGTFNAEMQNQFALGERIFVAFERLRPQTQRLELAFAYPYMLDLPFGIELKFNQYKRDSTYTDVMGDFGVSYLFEGGNYLKAFWNTTSSNLLSIDTNAIRQGRFPDQLDVKNTAFGLEGNWQRLDYRFNPRRGWNVLLRASAGNRRIRRNQTILNVAENFYDTLPAKTFRFLLDANLERYFPIMQRSAVKLGTRSGAILSEKPVYLNEQYRIGGSRLLRGFDEESIFATFFNVFTVEYRLLVGQNSYFYLFGDYAYLEDRRAGKATRYVRPFGFGGGLTFETTAGVFGISLGVGGREGEPPNFRNPKLHFGYVSIF